MSSLPRAERWNQLQWAVTSPLLAAELLGAHGALELVLALTAITALAYALRLRSVRPYRVQVRLGFLAVVALGLVPGLAPLLLVPMLGTASQVLFGYCPMARLLDLAPWNRGEALSFAFVARTFLRPPGGEGLCSGWLARSGVQAATRSARAGGSW